MNNVQLTGRLTKDVEVKDAKGTSVARFNLAVNNPFKKDEADFPTVVVFGKSAENTAKYCGKGSLVEVVGRLQTGSYKNKEGATVYTTEVIADRVGFLETKGGKGGSGKDSTPAASKTEKDFEEVADDMPF